MTCLIGSFFTSDMYLVSNRGHTQFRDSEFESWDLTSSYVIAFREFSNFLLQARDIIIKESQLLGCSFSGRCPGAELCMKI